MIDTRWTTQNPPEQLLPVRRLFASLLLFGASFGFVEAAVVAYLRPHYEAVHAHAYPERREDDFFPLLRFDQLQAAGSLPAQLLIVELVREVATLVMLAAVGLAIAQNFRQWVAGFAIAFGVWDLCYYLFLKVLLDWPDTLLTWDLLFLLPVPWVGPVVAPVLVSVSLVGAGALVLKREARGDPVRLGGANGAAILLGGILIVTSFCCDYLHLMSGGMPRDFNWTLFSVGEAVGLAAFGRACRARPLKGR
jgi:hypothetical protein